MLVKGRLTLNRLDTGLYNKYKIFSRITLNDIATSCIEDSYGKALELERQYDRCFWFERGFHSIHTDERRRIQIRTTLDLDVFTHYESLASHHGIPSSLLLGECIKLWLHNNRDLLSTERKGHKRNTKLTLMEKDIVMLKTSANKRNRTLSYLVTEAIENYKKGKFKVSFGVNATKVNKGRRTKTGNITLQIPESMRLIQDELNTLTMTTSYIIARIVEEYLNDRRTKGRY